MSIQDLREDGEDLNTEAVKEVRVQLIADMKLSEDRVKVWKKNGGYYGQYVVEDILTDRQMEIWEEGGYEFTISEDLLIGKGI